MSTMKCRGNIGLNIGLKPEGVHVRKVIFCTRAQLGYSACPQGSPLSLASVFFGSVVSYPLFNPLNQRKPHTPVISRGSLWP